MRFRNVGFRRAGDEAENSGALRLLTLNGGSSLGRREIRARVFPGIVAWAVAARAGMGDLRAVAVRTCAIRPGDARRAP